MSESDSLNDQNTEVSEASSNPDTLESKDLQSELQKLKNEYLYLAAEFDNYKKQAIKERSELIKYGAERFIREVLEVTDNFERALQVELNPDNIDAFKNGIAMIHQEIISVLQKFGVSEVPSEGKVFDPNLHEALSSEESSDLNPGHVLRVFKKAYKYHDRMIRPAQVVVSKLPSEPKES